MASELANDLAHKWLAAPLLEVNELTWDTFCSDIDAAIAEAVRQERDECAKLCDAWGNKCGCGDLIRNRKEQPDDR